MEAEWGCHSLRESGCDGGNGWLDVDAEGVAGPATEEFDIKVLPGAAAALAVAG